MKLSPLTHLDFILRKLIFLIHLHRSDTSRSELAELSKQANPDEINLDEDDDDDEEQGPEGECVTKYIWGKSALNISVVMKMHLSCVLDLYRGAA